VVEDCRGSNRNGYGARINRVSNDDAECSVSVELAKIQNRLFT
jgi:hypothetical protein